MGELHFAITADNSDFVQRMNEVKSGARATAEILTQMSRDFDMSTPEQKLISLNKVMSDTEHSIEALSRELEQMSKDATAALADGDYSTFDELTNKMIEQREQIAGLVEQVEQYQSAISVVESASGMESSEAPASAPMLFSNEADYQAAEDLRAKVQELQEQIANFDGSAEDLQPLKDALAQSQTLLQSMEMTAMQTASELGAGLGGKAAEASSALYELNSSIKNQKETIDELTKSVEEAAAALEALEGSEDTSAIDEAQLRYDYLTNSLRNAQTEMLNMQAAQTDAKAKWAEVSAEVEKHDSIMVKMLGGQESYNKIVSQLPGPLQSVIGGMEGMTGAAKAFIATPLGAIIAVIVLALQALKTWFDSSVEGQMAFAEISGYVSGVLAQLKEIVITVGKAIYNAFKDPKKAVSDLWEAIKTNIVNRLKALGSLAAHVGEMISAAFTPGKSVSDAWGKIQDDIIQLGTGIENATDKVKNYVKSVHDAAKETAEIAKANKQLDIDQHEWSKRAAELNKTKAQAQQVFMDSSKSASERQKAMDDYKDAVQEQYDKEREFADKRIELQERQMKITTNQIEDENKLRDLQAARINLDARQAQEMASLQRRQNGITNAGLSAEKSAQSMKDAQQKLADDLEKMRDNNIKAEIAQMEDGNAKRLATIEANYKAQKTAIEKQEHELAKANRKAKMSGLGDDGLTDAQRSELNKAKKLNDSAYTKEKAEVLKEEAAAMREYLKEYGTFQQQKLAIAEEYAEKIRKAQSEGEKLSLQKERDKAIHSVDMVALQQNIDWQAVFGGFTGMLQSQLKETLSELKDYTKTDKFKSSSAEDKKLIYEAIDRIQQQLPGDNAGTLNFSSIAEKMEKFGEAVNRAQKAAQDDIVAQNRLTEAKTRYEEAVKSGTAAEQQKAKIELEMAETLANSATTALNQANTDVENMGRDLSESSSATIKGLNGVASGLQDFASGTLSGAFSGLQKTLNGLSELNLGEKVNKAVGSLSEALSSAGTIGAIISAVLSILDVLKDGIGPLISSMIDTVLGAVSGILEDILKGKFIMQIGESLMKGIKGVFNALTFGGFSSWFGSRESDKNYKKDMEKLTASNEQLQKSLDRLNDTMEKASIASAGNVLDTQKDFLQTKESNLAEQILRSAKNRKKDNIFGNGGHSSGEYLLGKNTTSTQWRKVAQAVGKEDEWSKWLNSFNADWSSKYNVIESFLSLSASDMKKVADEVPDLWYEICQYLSQGYKDATEYMEEYISLPDQLKEIEDAYAEKLTDTTFDSVKDGFKSMLLDMESDRDDFVGDFEKKLQQAIVNSMMDEKYTESLKKWYANFTSAMRDGALSAAERDALKQDYDRIVDEALTERDALKSAFGWGGTTESQSATGGYSTQLSEDTGTEISGRLTAIQDQGYVKIEILRDTYGEIITLKGFLMARNTILEDLQEGYCVRVLEYLQELSKSAKSLVAINSNVEEIKKLVKNI